MRRPGDDVPPEGGARSTVPAGSERSPAPLQLQLFPGGSPSRRADAKGKPPAPEPAPESADAPKAGKRNVLSEEDLPDPGAEALAHRLRRALPRRLGSLTLTDNRSTIVSAREADGRLDVRIQRCFASAPDETLAAVATFLSSGKRSRARHRALASIRAYFERHRPSPALARRRRRIVLRPVGQTLDLREVRDRINREYFDDALSVHVTWGRRPSRRRPGKRNNGFSVRLGTYNDHDRVVRIHRCLDRAEVPLYVVESVVYHEMLHAAEPPVVENGRRRIHTPEFRRRERLFPSYQRAERWLGRNLKRLI